MKRYSIWVITLILLVAAALRLWALPQLPVGLHYDEAANAILTRQITTGNYWPLFIRAYTGKEVLFFYAAAPWVWMTGGAAWGLRFGAAMVGVLTIAATYTMTRALLEAGKRARWAALLSAAWMAVLFPHVLLSRYGFRAISQPLLQALTVTALWHGLRTRKHRWLIASGACLGLTGYTYLAARLFPIPLGLAMGYLLIHTPKQQRARQSGHLVLTLAAAIIVFAPLGLYFVRNPETFTTRIAQVAAPSWQDAARGFWHCIEALAWPGKGDAYVRFNVPGRPILDGISGLLALGGWISLLFTSRRDALGRSAVFFLTAVLAIMVLPSALATSEITPSNLRMVGLFPFLAIFPAWGTMRLLEILQRLKIGRPFFANNHRDTENTERNTRKLRGLCVSVVKSSPIAPLFLSISILLLAGGIGTWRTYVSWATSSDLFNAANGDMVVVAKALDAADLGNTTVYIASEHYRHPTVAALARNYSQAKWLTGGATLVLPPAGDALYLIPRTQPPPAPWPDSITQAWVTTPWPAPDGTPVMLAHRLTAEAIAQLRPTEPSADFAHVVLVYDAQPLAPCYVATACNVQVTWEARAPYPTLQPVVRLVHPRTGEWSRKMEFHYPSEQWTVGDVVLDQFALYPPSGTPPGKAYQLGVGFYNPATGEALPRLEAERFAGLEARFPIAAEGFEILSTPDTVAAGTPSEACAGIPTHDVPAWGGVALLGWSSLPDIARPGERHWLKLCWHKQRAITVSEDIVLRLVGPEIYEVYAGPPAEEYGLSAWLPGEFIQGRYALRLPKDTVAGDYVLQLALGAHSVELDSLHIQSVQHRFNPPEIAHPFQADFGKSIRLLGYDVGDLRPGQPLTVTLYWQLLKDVEQDYVVFVHLVNQATEETVAQVDEGPQNNNYPTSLWVQGEIVADTHRLSLPDPLRGETYSLRVGFYRQETGDYLTLNADDAWYALDLPPIKK